jgi:hypothetical protein
MQVTVIAAPHEQWPLPWYLRTMPHVGYWTAPGDALALQAPVIVASTDHEDFLDGALGDRYVSEFYGLRPEVLLALYIERGLWERSRGRGQAGACARPPRLHRRAHNGTDAPRTGLVVPCTTRRPASTRHLPS